MHTNKAIAPGNLTLKADSGEFELAFSPIDVVDLDGDIVRRSAIPDGIKLPLLQGHMQHERAVGVGTVSHNATHAVLKGSFIDSTAGRDAHATVKATADIQELSWGFSIVEANSIAMEGKNVREIVKTRPHEVSLVLRGAAGPGKTGVIAVKTADEALKFATEGEAVLAAVLAFKGRADALAALRAGEDRNLSGTAKTSLLTMATTLEEMLPSLKALTEAVEEKSDVPEDFTSRLQAVELRLISQTARSI